ncbi:cupin domain-containing protein [Pseudoroseicyclus sp. H15]
MLIKSGSLAATHVEGSAPRMEVRFGEAAGMRLGANLVTLQPGDRSARRHWHQNEDEFLYMVSGEATLVDDNGPQPLLPGDVCCWPAGVENAHHVLNTSDAPVTYLVLGTNPEVDNVRYPDEGNTLYHEPPRWRLEQDDGTILQEGDT